MCGSGGSMKVCRRAAGRASGSIELETICKVKGFDVVSGMQHRSKKECRGSVGEPVPTISLTVEILDHSFIPWKTFQVSILARR